MKPLPHLRHIKIICVLLCEPRGKGKNGNQKSFNFAKKGKGYFPTNPSLKKSTRQEVGNRNSHSRNRACRVGFGLMYSLYVVKMKECNMEANIEFRMQQKAESHGISLDLLTPEELTMLREEVEKEAKGIFVIDGVLHNPAIIYRRISKNN